MSSVEAGEERCPNCGESDDTCACCTSCDGNGYIEDGGCGGGCEFCRPFPRCGACRGSGKREMELAKGYP